MPWIADKHGKIRVEVGRGRVNFLNAIEIFVNPLNAIKWH